MAVRSSWIWLVHKDLDRRSGGRVCTDASDPAQAPLHGALASSAGPIGSLQRGAAAEDEAAVGCVAANVATPAKLPRQVGQFRG